MATRSRLAVATAAAVGTIYGVQGLSPALPVVQRHLGLTDSELGLFTAAYMLPAVVFAMPLGYLADRVGRRRVFVSMTLLWSVAGALQAWAGSSPALMALRVLQGIGFAALMPLSVTLIGDALEGAAQLRAQASRQVIMQVGELVWPLVGAALAAFSWRAPLAAQLALLPLAVAGVRVLDDHATAVAQSTRGYARELAGAVRAPGMPAVLTAGFVRFWCKFAVVAYVPLMLVREAGASIGQGALVVAITSLFAALASTRVMPALRRVPASRL
ncbi:MAG TPA: MFS transporter, partial [Solirubrobacter sp.]